MRLTDLAQTTAPSRHIRQPTDKLAQVQYVMRKPIVNTAEFQAQSLSSMSFLRRMAFRAMLLAAGGLSAAGAPSARAQQLLEKNSPKSMSPASESKEIFLSTAHFQIPFNVGTAGSRPALVQLWVSTDEGASWQKHGNAEPSSRQFDFRAAAEGVYLFSVKTVDTNGITFPSSSKPLRLTIDTTEPQAAVRADVNASDQLTVEVRVVDQHLDLNSGSIRIRSNRSGWQEHPLSLQPAADASSRTGPVYEGKLSIPKPAGRDLAIIFTASDLAKNLGTATTEVKVPLTASAKSEMQLASGGKLHSQIKGLPGATLWEPADSNSQRTSKPVADSAGRLPPMQAGIVGKTSQPRSAEPPNGPGKLAAGPTQSILLPGEAEELPLPAPIGERTYPTAIQAQDPLDLTSDLLKLGNEEPATTAQRAPVTAMVDAIEVPLAQAFQSRSRAFKLDYSVEALGGTQLSQVELWGTEDAGRSWQKWGADPDRQSPFDVKVGNDGLFGFRMVVVGGNGVVSKRPTAGQPADAWINIDTTAPKTKITRAVYGKGADDGRLVIDFECNDENLADRPISLLISEFPQGPWTTIATGLTNNGIHLWKVDPNLPDRVYLKIEAIDKAGNVGSYQLDLPIDIRGLTPHGRIQGFRPILD